MIFMRSGYAAGPRSLPFLAVEFPFPSGLPSLFMRWIHEDLISPDISVHPHIMRHAKATHLVDSGKVSLKDVRDFLGHESVVTTEIYLSSNPEHTRKAIEEAFEALCIPKTGTYSEKKKESLDEFLKTRRL